MHIQLPSHRLRFSCGVDVEDLMEMIRSKILCIQLGVATATCVFKWVTLEATLKHQPSEHFTCILAFSVGELSGGAGGLSSGSPFGAALSVAVTPENGFGRGGAFLCDGLYKGHALC